MLAKRDVGARKMEESSRKEALPTSDEESVTAQARIQASKLGIASVSASIRRCGNLALSGNQAGGSSA